MSSCSSWGKKKQQQQTDPQGEDKNKKQHNWEWIYEMYIFRFETQTFLEQNTPLRIVKLLELKLKPMNCFFFNLENKPA